MHLTLEKVSIRRDNFSLLASGTFYQGVHLLTGKVGSGKSTLGEILCRVIEPADGRMTYDGIRTSVLSMQFPEYHITTTTVVEEILSWKRDPDQVLETAGLQGRGCDDLLTLSRGELKRIHLACMLLGKYDLMVLDEPFAGLDEEARYWISSHLSQNRDGITIIISHDITTLPSINHLWEMQEGILSEIGNIPGALRHWKNPPPLIRFLLKNDPELSGLSWQDLVEAACRIRG
ncbi:ATP-binding cassette domain-containing protein [Methanospirillum lacunae]|uniref:ABC transporter n=1 Tax=Methanospirillum lacunae TaxID=668570 RepID=A0A2V2MQX1_9EURY|nr:ATP-binding cassette domain-containing protein [Methanospirillum lacunae]PWR70542.1 ABC transporter [Methanospirillum lacunae]